MFLYQFQGSSCVVGYLESTSICMVLHIPCYWTTSTGLHLLAIESFTKTCLCSEFGTGGVVLED